MYASERKIHDVQDRIAKDLANHEITVVHRNGIFGHWRCRKPGTICMGFEIVTWPGHLAFTGDMGDYVFCRTHNMIAFMRQSWKSTSYAAEKCVAACLDGITEWSEDDFREELREARKLGKEAREKTAEIFDAYSINSDPHVALAEMWESGLWDELPNCQTYTMRFLWCLHAIGWFCDRVDEHAIAYEG